MSFHEVRFPTDISFGSSGGPERRTDVVTLVNGFEERNSPWAQSRRRYDAGLGVRHLDDLAALLAFFEARQGRLFGFRWKDWTDFTSGLPSASPDPSDQVLGVGDGATLSFQLVKAYASGGVEVQREIHKPTADSVRVALDGNEETNWSVDPVTGIVTFDTPPAAGVIVSAGYTFDVPVRFDTDRLEITVSAFEAGSIPDIPIVEIRT